MSPKLKKILEDAQREMRGNAHAFSAIVDKKIDACPAEERDAHRKELKLLAGFEAPDRPKYEH